MSVKRQMASKLSENVQGNTVWFDCILDLENGPVFGLKGEWKLKVFTLK